tara:strand:+ start:2626 stop:2823 length:198 start_codon:yes stop_codon:yes gene_type:complete
MTFYANITLREGGTLLANSVGNGVKVANVALTNKQVDNNFANISIEVANLSNTVINPIPFAIALG